MSNPITEATTKVHAVLEPLTSDERRGVVQAVLTLLGDDVSLRVPSAGAGKADVAADEGSGSATLPPKAQAWTKKNELSVEQLEHYFHFDNGNVTCIELPGKGKGKRQMAIHTYLMQGVAALLSNGEPEFSNEDARKLCEHFGCYDAGNHSKTLKEFGNAITGSRSRGWKLTAPGLNKAAELIKTA
jgi:hypothetical protein